MDMTNRLRSHLARQSDALYPLGKGPEAAVAAGSRIRHQRIAGLFAVSLVVVASAGFAALTLRYSPGSTDLDIATPPVDPAPAAVDVGPVAFGGGEVVESDLDWSIVDSTLGGFGEVFSWEGSFYTLATAPGKIDPSDWSKPGFRVPKAIYTSTDGASWTHRLISDDLGISVIDHYQGTLYAVGTAPGFAETSGATVEVFVATTEDWGVSWERTDLPVVAAPPVGFGDVVGGSVSSRIVAGPKGVVTIVDGWFAVDYSPFVPPEYRGERMDVYRTEDGIEVRDWTVVEQAERACAAAAEPVEVELSDGSTTGFAVSCEEILGEDFHADAVVFAATWDELGVSEPPAVRYSEMFVSSDGSNFDAVDSPFAMDSFVRLHALDDGFLGIDAVYSEGETVWRIWLSPDGRTWERVGVPPNFLDVTAVGQMGNIIVLAGVAGTWETSVPVVAFSEDGGTTWQSVNLSFPREDENETYVWWMTAADIGPHGVVLALQSQRFSDTEELAPSASTTSVFITTDLNTWSEAPLSELGVGSGGVYLGGIVNDGENVMISVTRWEGVEETQYSVLIGS